MSVRSPTAGTWSSSQWRPDNEFETDTTYVLTAIGIDGPDTTAVSEGITFEITSTGLRSLVER